MKLLPLFSGVVCLTSAALAQTSEFHTFTPPPLGTDIIWPPSIQSTHSLSPGQLILPGVQFDSKISIYNDLNNLIFFDDNYIAAKNAPNITDDAMWSDPQDGNYMDIDFGAFFTEDAEENVVDQVTRVSFEFAWWSTNLSADLTYLALDVYDYSGNLETVFIDLDQTFTFNSFDGYSGYIDLEVGVNVLLDNISYITFSDFSQLDPGPDQGEFAIDNLSVNSGGGEENSSVSPVNYDGSPRSDYRTNSLKGQGIFGIGDNVRNSGNEATTFSVLWSGSSPLIYQATPFNQYPIGANQTVQNAVEWAINTNTAPSGEYSGVFTIINDLNLDDDDDTLTLISYKLYDPPLLSGNSGATLVVHGGNQATITNASASGHPGALRASVQITDVVRSNPRFTVTGMAKAQIVNYVVLNPAVSVVNPGETLQGTFAFNAAGATAGTHIGSFRVKLEMTTPSVYLNRDQPVPDRVWALSYTVPPKPTAAPAVTTGQNFADVGADISGSETGAALIGGTSSSDQTVTLDFNDTPAVTNPSGYGSAIDLDFGTTEELYVLQLSYTELPEGYSASDLRIQALDAAAWVPAISLNGNGGTPVTGAQPYLGSYATYLADLGGNTLDATDLGAFGIDTASKTVWVVLDYEGTFQLITGAYTTPFKILEVTHEALTNTTTISYQSQPGVPHQIVGGMTPDSIAPLGTTALGTGGIMTFQHQPAGAPPRFFYRMSKP